MKSKNLKASHNIDWATVKARRLVYPAAAIVFLQGDTANTVMYIEGGLVRLSVLSRNGKEAVVAILESEAFFGESCLAEQTKRMATATTMWA